MYDVRKDGACNAVLLQDENPGESAPQKTPFQIRGEDAGSCFRHEHDRETVSSHEHKQRPPFTTATVIEQ